MFRVSGGTRGLTLHRWTARERIVLNGKQATVNHEICQGS
jgi:hypothetical protein